MIDLISLGINHGLIKGREYVEIPSILFVKKCEETVKLNPPGPGLTYSPF